MSRSRKKRAITGITTAESERWDKVFAHRKFRKTAKRYLKSGNIDRLPLKLREISDVWMFVKDGKIDWECLSTDSFWVRECYGCTSEDFIKKLKRK